MNPSVDVGPFAIYWYGIFVVTGFLATVVFSYIEWRKKGYSRFHYMNIFWIAIISGLWGARVWYLIFNPADINGLFSFFQISQGRSIQGSIFFGSLSLFLYNKHFMPEVEWRYTFSILIPNILIGQAIGRWGNFADQNVYGSIVQNSDQGLFAMLPTFIKDGMLIAGDYRQPVFLYESIADLMAWILINKVIKSFKQVKPGVHGGMYFFTYGLIRASLELFRDDKYIMKINNFPTSFLLALIFMVLGIMIMIYYQCFYKQGQFFFKYQLSCYNAFIKNIFKIEVSWDQAKKQLQTNLATVKKTQQENLYNSIYEYYF